ARSAIRSSSPTRRPPSARRPRSSASTPTPCWPRSATRAPTARGSARAASSDAEENPTAMPGIVAAAAYVPRYRLPRELIAREWGRQSAGGEKAVANHDEDSLTLAVSAALALEEQGERPDGLFFATTTPPYTQKQGAASVPGASEARYGCGRVLGEALKGVLARAKVSPEALATVILPTPSPRAPQTIVQALGLDAKRQLQDSFWTTLGDTGAAQPLLMLAAALERAKAGDLVLVAGYGDGADALLLRVTAAAAAAGPTVSQQIEVKRTLPSYGRYARFRKLVRKESAASDLSSAVVMF